MACQSNSTSSKAMDKDAEIFDRLFELDEGDINWINDTIAGHMKECKKYLGQSPPQWKEALREAEEASFIALAERVDEAVVSGIDFYKAKCYRGLGKWEESYSFYTANRANAQNTHLQQGPQTPRKQKMEGKRNVEPRRARGSGDLHTAYSDKTKRR